MRVGDNGRRSTRRERYGRTVPFTLRIRARQHRMRKAERYQPMERILDATSPPLYRVRYLRR